QAFEFNPTVSAWAGPFPLATATWLQPSVYLTPQGTAYAAAGDGLSVSTTPQLWSRYSGSPELQRAGQVAGVGNTLYLLAPRPGSTATRGDSLTLYRLAGGSAVDLHLPAGARTGIFSRMAVVGENEVYVRPDIGGDVLYWNGSTWSTVTVGSLATVQASPAAGVAYVAGQGAGEWSLYLLRGGKLTPVPVPLLSSDIQVGGMGVDAQGDPYLVYGRRDASYAGLGGVIFRSGGAWKKVPVRGDWSLGKSVWADADGTIWLTAYRPVERASGGAVLWEWDVLRIQTR
ncbi:MAG: hypothetical protein JO040_06370, partial [Gemmatimonadetes bacterium]|nr:hypothetical protein [Gemmatimonadota bacterium]